jgi:hypothetical protein
MGRIRSRVPGSLAALAVLASAMVAGPAGTARAEPQAQLRVSREPYYVGVAMDLHVVATGFERDPAPTCSVDPPASGALQLSGVVPNISSSIQIINGRVTKSESVTHTCQYRFTPSAPGTFSVGPFRVAQGGVERATRAHSVRVQQIPRDPNLKVRILLPATPIYVGQQTPIAIEWWIEDALQSKIGGYTLRSELFDRDDTFRFVGDEAPVSGEQSLEIQSAAGPLRLRAEVAKRREGGRSFLVVAAQRTLIPLRAGTFDLAPGTIEVDAVTRWQRDLFGGRRPADTRRIFSQDEPRRLVVKAPPLAGRPATFAGAVGRGFSLEVTADRSVVQRGDPIALTLTVRGSGNLATAGLPPLDAEGGLSRDQFRLPESEPPGVLEDEAKVFRVSLRVLDDAVREIPAIAYSWFDPDLGEYRTARSRPIALSVRPAHVISAADVIGSPRDPSDGRMDEPPADGAAEGKSTPGGVRLIGADLSIEQDIPELMRRRTPTRVLRIGAYGASLLVLVIAIGLRRRADVDPALQRRRAVYAAQRTRLQAARSLPRREALAEMAAALREIVTEAPELRGDDLDTFVRDCDAVIYAPGAGGDEETPPELLERADALIAAMGEALR